MFDDKHAPCCANTTYDIAQIAAASIRNKYWIYNIQYVQIIINMNIIIRHLCENPWELDSSAGPWTTAELKPRQLLSEVSRRNPRLWGEVTRPLPRHGPTFSSCYQHKYWAPEIPKWLKEFHRIENKGHGGSLMSKHRLDLLFDTIKPILDVCIYPISHQTNMTYDVVISPWIHFNRL